LREILTLIEVGSDLGVGRDDWVVMHLLENRFENQMVIVMQINFLHFFFIYIYIYRHFNYDEHNINIQ
jgi:hypothetical protein